MAERALIEVTTGEGEGAGGGGGSGGAGGMTARVAVAADFAGAEVLVEDAGDAGAAWQQLEPLLGGAAGGDDEDHDHRWMAWVEIGGDAVLVRAEAGTWSIWAPAGSAPDDVAMAARRVHGRLGVQHEGWDLDR